MLTKQASDDFLDRLFEMFYRKLGLPNLMQKSNFHLLARNVPVDLVDPEIGEVLDAIRDTVERARPFNG